MFANIEQHIAQGTNVVFFIPMSIAAICVFIKNRNIKFKVGIPICCWGLVGTFIGATISARLNVNILKKGFGAFLILIAIYQSYSLYKGYIKAKKRNNNTKQ